ncbi:MAG: aminopeptidase P family protein [Caldilineales bacterium]|nr:aminopeptidase P family protein [Caldilineales bacterium]
MNEFERRDASIRQFMADNNIDELLLNRVANFAWATCGAASYVNTATTTGEAWLLITDSAKYLLANNIEATRLEGEEKLVEQGWRFMVNQWYVGSGPTPARGNIGADVSFAGAQDVSGALAEYRTHLSPEEQGRFRWLGEQCAGAMNDAIRAVKPGMNEYEIAGLLAGETQRRGVQPIVNLIAVDENIFKYRHPLPTGRVMERYAMLVLCGRWKGLVASVTRLVHFGKLSDELRRKMRAVAEVDAEFIASTRPGMTLGEVFANGQEAYARTGFGDEWMLHHQGGPASYEPRDFVATPGAPQVVAAGQAYAWNPSITGTKSEDTILVGPDGNEVLTTILGWPMIEVKAGDSTMLRPAILEID